MKRRRKEREEVDFVFWFAIGLILIGVIHLWMGQSWVNQ